MCAISSFIEIRTGGLRGPVKRLTCKTGKLDNPATLKCASERGNAKAGWSNVYCAYFTTYWLLQHWTIRQIVRVGRYVGWECEGVDQRTDGAGEHFDGWESVLIVDDIFGVFLRRPGDRHSQRDLSRHKYYLKLVVKRKFASFWTGLSPFGAWAYERMPGATGYWPTTMVDARPGPPSRPQWGDNVKPHPLIYRPVQQ